MRFLLLFLSLFLQFNAVKANIPQITENEKLSIATNYMGTPEAMYREDGEAVWKCELNSYGKVRKFQGKYVSDCPFRYQGQYEDAETGLYYNRFRYYSAEEGIYLSQDRIGLRGGNNLYGYVKDTNIWIDCFGLKGCELKDAEGDDHDFVLELDKNEYEEAFGHIDDVIKSGKYPDIWEIDRQNAESRRKDNLKGVDTKPCYDRDEAPMAMFKEGAGADVRYINPSDNRGAGSSVNAATKDLPDGTKLKIKVIN